MGEQLRRDSQFSDRNGKAMYSDYLNSETDMLFTPNLDGLRCDSPSQ